MDTAAAAKQPTLTQSLLRFFVDQGLDQCFSAMLFACHDSIAPDVVLELAWKHNLTNFAMPYMIQTFQQYHQRMAAVEKKLEEQVKEKKEDKAKDAEIQQGAQDAIGLGLVPGNNVPMIPMLTMAPGMGQGMGQGMGGNMGMGMGGNMGMGMGMGNGNQGW
jgi:clathrin heavy chain